MYQNFQATLQFPKVIFICECLRFNSLHFPTLVLESWDIFLVCILYCVPALVMNPRLRLQRFILFFPSSFVELTPFSQLSSCTLWPKERRNKRKCNIIYVIVCCVHLFVYIILYSFIHCVKPNKCICVFIFTFIMF